MTNQPTIFDLQGHRGARGLKPENTLPSFEAAFDAGVNSVETDIHLTADGVPVLIHDAFIDRDGQTTLVRSLTLAELRHYRVGANPDPDRFPTQSNDVTALAGLVAESRSIDPYSPPTLDDLLVFALAYAGDIGARAGKSAEQRKKAASIRFDLELKRVPFHPEYIGDGFGGQGAALIEESVVAAVRAAGVVERTTARSFDHRAVRAIVALEPRLTGAILIDGTAPVEPAKVARQAGAAIYCPDFQFLDEALIQSCHAEGVRVLPWTVNKPKDCQRLLDWGVDGITTDYPDQLADLLRERGIFF